MPRSRITVLFLNVGHLLDHFFMLILPTAVLSLEIAWHRPYGELLALGTAGFVAFGVGTLPSGWLGDRWNRGGMMAVFFIGLGAASVATGFAQGPLQLAIGLTFIGLFASIYHPVGIAMVVEESAAMGKALGVNGVWGNLGVALAAVTTAALTQHFGWRTAFMAPGMISILVGIAWIFHIQHHDLAAHAAKRRPRQTVALPRSSMRRVIGVVIIGSLAGGLVFSSATVVLPKLYAEQLHGLATDPTRIGGFVTLTFALAGIAQVFVGHLLDRYPLKPLYVLIPLCQVPLLLLVVVARDVPLLATSFLLFLFMFGGVPISDWMVGRYATSEWRARVYAAKQVMSLGVGMLTLPLVAFLHDRAGDFSTLLTLLALLALAVSFAGLFLPSERGAVLRAS